MAKEIELYGEFGPADLGMIDASGFVQQLPKRGDLVLRINSAGGDVFVGNAIYNVLQRYTADGKGQVTAVIDSLAASAATWVMQAAARIEAAPSAMLMIHEAKTLVWGGETELESGLSLVRKWNDTYARQTASRSGMAIRHVRDAMAAETWYTADEAEQKGLIDGVQQDLPAIAACCCDLIWNSFQHRPEQLTRDSAQAAAAGKRNRMSRALELRRRKFEQRRNQRCLSANK